LLPFFDAASPPAAATIAAPATVAGTFIFSNAERPLFALLADDFDLVAFDFDFVADDLDFAFALLAVDFDLDLALLEVGFGFLALEPALADLLAFFEPPVDFLPVLRFRGFVLV
jgi:hypothetical protein